MDNLTHWESIFIYKIKFSSHRICRSKGRWFLNTDRHFAWTFRQVRLSSTSACKREQIPSSSSVPFNCPPFPGRSASIHPVDCLHLLEICSKFPQELWVQWFYPESHSKVQTKKKKKNKKQKPSSLWDQIKWNKNKKESFWNIVQVDSVLWEDIPPRHHKRGEVLSAEDCVFYKWRWQSLSEVACVTSAGTPAKGTEESWDPECAS